MRAAAREAGEIAGMPGQVSYPGVCIDEQLSEAHAITPVLRRPWPSSARRGSIDRLIPYARNARTHSDEQVAQIAASIREFGFTNPVLVDEEGTLIAGHGRVLGAQQLGITDVPTMVARGWTPAQIQAYRLADNKLALNAGWDPELLRLELGELKLSGFDLSLTGFADLELKDIMADRTAGLTDPDDAPAVPEHPVSQTGDLWLLGLTWLTLRTFLESTVAGIIVHSIAAFIGFA